MFDGGLPLKEVSVWLLRVSVSVCEKKLKKCLILVRVCMLLEGTFSASILLGV